MAPPKKPLPTGGASFYVPTPGVSPGAINPPPPPSSPMRLQGEGLVLRISPIKGITPASVLGKKIWLPAVLNNFTITEDSNHTEYDTLSAGQFSTPAQGNTNARRLRELSGLETLTIDFEPSWIVASGQNPWDLRVRVFEILRSKKPVQVLGTFHPHPDQHSELFMSCTFRSITREIRPAERDTRYLTIDIKEWRNAAVHTRAHIPKSRKKGVHLPTTHKLKATDTLDSLSHEYYGTYEWWRIIRGANGIPKRWGAKTPIVKLGGHFKVGHKIKIPAAPTGGAPVTKRKGGSKSGGAGLAEPED